MKDMKKLVKILVVMVLLMNTACSHKKITDLRGKVKLETINLSSKVPGRVAEIRVNEGQSVKKGDTILVLDTPEISAKYEQAQGAVRAAKAQLRMAYNGATIEQVNQINGKLEAAEAQLNFAKESYERIKNMYQDSLVPPQKFDEVKMKLKMAQAQVNAINAKQKEVLKGTRQEVIEQAKGQLERALGKLKEVEVALKEKYVIAPQDLKIETISLKKGELATPGYTLVSGYLPNQIYFRFTIPESKIHQYKVNQEVNLVNPYTNQTIKGKIIAIKQLPRYADITAPSEAYQLTESVYELKIIPVNAEQKNLYQNAVILMK
jgi:HlyD family secretion protein